MRRLRKELELKLGVTLHMGANAVVRDVFPYLRIMFANDKAAATKLLEAFDLDETLISSLRDSDG